MRAQIEQEGDELRLVSKEAEKLLAIHRTLGIPDLLVREENDWPETGFYYRVNNWYAENYARQ